MSNQGASGAAPAVEDGELPQPGELEVRMECADIKVGDLFSTFQDFKASIRLHPQSDIVYIMDLENWSCSCLRFQNTDIPCGHAVALIDRLQKSPADIMPSYVKNRTLINSYAQNFYPIDLVDARNPPPEKARPKDIEVAASVRIYEFALASQGPAREDLEAALLELNDGTGTSVSKNHIRKTGESLDETLDTVEVLLDMESNGITRKASSG
ncbi:hypothetical protein FN846DRAFT_914969 [Sphaerosporella brunnea]|uniref:SWIM-type domain-containing protein n=1 Tax=Sphaerosporella brunnea TaxID=1250544 RepID=A0A5J5EBP3_9PEZI|nr:hypothetical protein FN846DRAFT_914969 [Sphaerosporella brunnea]